MSDYILTTEQVRDYYREVVSVLADGTLSKIEAERFDHWIAQHDAEVAKATQERIIALLEPFTHLKCELGCDDCDDDFAYAIALIKGDNK